MIPNYRTSRDAAAAETAMPENPIPALKKEAQNGFPRQKNSSNTAGTQNATVTDAVVGAVVTRDDDDRSKRLGQDLDPAVGKIPLIQPPVGFLLGWRNTSRNGRENRALVTTSHLFWPNQRRNGGLSLRFWLPNSNCLGTERNPGPDRLATRRRVRGGRGWKRRRLPMLLMVRRLTEILAKRAPVAPSDWQKKALIKFSLQMEPLP